WESQNGARSTAIRHAVSGESVRLNSTARGSPSPTSALVGPCGRLVIGRSTSLLLRLGAAEISDIYTVNYGVGLHLITTLLTPARMGRVLAFYNQDQAKNQHL